MIGGGFDREAVSYARNPQRHADIYLSEYYHPATGYFELVWWREDFYHWQENRYKRVPASEIETGVIKHLVQFNRGSERAGDATVEVTRSLVSSIMMSIKSEVHVPFWVEPPVLLSEGYISSPCVAFSNGLVCLAAIDKDYIDEITNPTPKNFNLTSFPYSYDAEAKCSRWDAFLDEVMEGDAERIRLLRQWAGYLLTSDLRHHKFMLLAGEGSNGKTTFTTAIENMLGGDNVSHVPISQFGDRFALAGTIGKMLNSTSESTRRIDEFAETVLKSYTSGDRMTLDRKFREPVQVTPTAKVMISTNMLPEFSDKSGGLWRRLLFVPFDKTIGEDKQDRRLGNDLYYERAGIFNWAYRGSEDLREVGRFVIPEICKQRVSNYRKQTNPARSFLTEHYTQTFDGTGIACREVYDAYRNWCDENGYRQMNSGNFGKEVKRAFKNVKRSYVRNNNSRYWVYEGIAKP